MADQWTLYYHPRFAGRGEFIRLIFEEAGVPYAQPSENVRELVMKSQLGGDGFPNFAPPVIKKGNFTLSQTPVICKYLGKEFGLWPETEADIWHADAINTTVHDFIAEGRLVFHGKGFVESYSTQKEETKPYIEWFKRERFAKWLMYLERCLAHNNGGHGTIRDWDKLGNNAVSAGTVATFKWMLSISHSRGTGPPVKGYPHVVMFVVGTKCTYVDLALLHVLRAAASQFPEEWVKLDSIPLLKAFKDRMSARPKLAAYFKSDRCTPFCGDSMM